MKECHELSIFVAEEVRIDRWGTQRVLRGDMLGLHNDQVPLISGDITHDSPPAHGMLTITSIACYPSNSKNELTMALPNSMM